MSDTPSSPLVFVPLSSGVRRGLESSVVGAREVVELGVGRVFDRLGIRSEGDPFGSGVPVGLSDSERVLRRVVGVKVRQAGGFDAAVEGVAFGVWHRMLFARFLAENDLLMHPEFNVAVSLADCGELADEGLGADRWVVASEFAAEMLPGLFPVDDPLGRVELLPEDLAELEAILDDIPSEVFVSDDGLGWVYQFWQSQAKDDVNASEVKIGARELPAVTQLFTEHYMVRFLLENSLGAWWAARHPESPLNGSFEYSRFDDEGSPAAGSFEGWPESVAEVTAMDPAAGSGHFLTSLFEMLWRMRVEEEGIDPVVAQDLVLSENLFGLELDPRCTEIAAFNVALTAWKAGGYRTLPELNIGCSGIRVAGSRDSWLELAGDDPRLRDGLERLHDVFKDADTLGSLIDPRRAVGDDSLLAAGWDEIQPLLAQVLEREKTDDPAAAVFGQQVTGVAKAANLLSRQYTLVATNPPWLGTGKADTRLRGFVQAHFPDSKNDLSVVFSDAWSTRAASGRSVAAVLPRNWLYLGGYRGYRDRSLKETRWDITVALGPRAFEAISGEAVNAVLLVTTSQVPTEDHRIWVVDVGGLNFCDKASGIREDSGLWVSQSAQLRNPESRFVFEQIPSGPQLSQFVRTSAGIQTGDSPRFIHFFWEMAAPGDDWVSHQSGPASEERYLGSERVLLWEDGHGRLLELVTAKLGAGGEGAWLRGTDYRGRNGVVVQLMGELVAIPFRGTLFDNNVGLVAPRNPMDAPWIFAFMSSESYRHLLRVLNPGMKLEPSALAKVPFDVEYWRGVAEREFPDGLPEPWSDDPTQWLYLGDPAESTDPLQVGMARLLGYEWPGQEPDALDGFVDEDGIVCLPAVAGELPAADRLRELLVTAFNAQDDPVGVVDGLLVDADAGGKSLGWWLENRFFKQHHQLFHKRPFVWHITDHHRDGFSALVNYHMLDRQGLERLAFTYLGWWIDKQRAGVISEVAGADDRLAAAVGLQDRLKLVLEGEPPFDIFVRWKTLGEQSIGWEPDLDDGVRLNVRPFVEAGVLKIRKPAGIKWGKDRGKNPDGSDRLNDLHYTRAEKQAARNNQ